MFERENESKKNFSSSSIKNINLGSDKFSSQNKNIVISSSHFIGFLERENKSKRLVSLFD